MFDGALLVTLREGVEISLIVGIILSCLRRLGRADGFRYVWLGTAFAVALSAAVGVVLYRLTGSGGEWAYQTYLEASIMFIAVLILSYMTFWMKRNSAALGSELHKKVAAAMDKQGMWSLVFLAFISVIREGIETAMFLIGLSMQSKTSPMPVVAGAIVGFLISAVIGWFIYRGTYKINLRAFFQVMGTLLIVVAAGLLASSIGALIEAHALNPIRYVFDWSGRLSEHGALGGVLHALVGYSDHPSILQAGAWLVYLATALYLYNRGTKPLIGRKVSST